jgi:TonB family protein
MTNFQCHYESLKVTPDAPPEVIRAAYRSLSQKHHPDKNAGNPEAARIMSRLNLAYSVLSDAVQRELYDLQRQHLRAQRHAFHEAADAGAAFADHADDPPDGKAGAGGHGLFGSLLRRAQARRGHVLATIVGVLVLGFAVAWWSIWNEQRTMLLLEHAAGAARSPAVDEGTAPRDAAAAPGAVAAAPATASEPAAVPSGAAVPPAVAKSTEYERLTALLKSMGLGLHRLDLPAPAPKRAAPPVPEPRQAAREAGATAAPRAQAGNPVPEPARARDEPPVAAEPVRGDAKSAPDASRPGAAPAGSTILSAIASTNPNAGSNATANANPDSVAPRQPVIIDASACAPVYPARAYANGETGTVRMALLVGADGNVIEAKVRKSSGSVELDRAARKALSQCKFKVAGSHAEPAWTMLEYVFSID